MRLAAEQAAAIKSGGVDAFGAEARVWLFGSRVRDDLLGGDIDRYVELPAQTEHVFARSVRLNGNLQMAPGEQPGAAIDNLNRIERWGDLSDVPCWLGMRRLRNRLVHEYLEHTVGLAEVLGEAQAFSLTMRETYGALREFARQRLALPLTATTNEATHV